MFIFRNKVTNYRDCVKKFNDTFIDKKFLLTEIIVNKLKTNIKENYNNYSIEEICNSLKINNNNYIIDIFSIKREYINNDKQIEIKKQKNDCCFKKRNDFIFK